MVKIGKRKISFNSLYEILGTQGTCANSSRNLSILFMRFPLIAEEGLNSEVAFNSLYEILAEGTATEEDYDASTFNSLYEIQKTKPSKDPYGEQNFQFSL